MARPKIIIKTDACLPCDRQFGEYEYTLYGDIMAALERRGMKVEDILGKKIGLSFKVGCRRKLKSFRFTEIRSYTRCECCGPITSIY